MQLFVEVHACSDLLHPSLVALVQASRDSAAGGWWPEQQRASQGADVAGHSGPKLERCEWAGVEVGLTGGPLESASTAIVKIEVSTIARCCEF